MNILVIGSGGRESAIINSIKNSRHNPRIFCAPGNGGISRDAEIVNIKADNLKELLAFARDNNIDITVVGPEVPLALGIVDEFSRAGLKAFGPSKEAALLESSKEFCKDFLKKYSIKTADYRVFSDFDKAAAFIKGRTHPLVIKASGLAAGKGVFISGSVEESLSVLDSMFNRKIFGKSGDSVVVEEFLKGFELSYMIVTDGSSYVPLVTSMDYKKVYDGNRGENTGGMGAITPNPFVSEVLEDKIKKSVIEPVLEGLRKEGIKYKGILYAGLMIDGENINVLEFNVRFGDPETQAILIRMESDIVDMFLAVIDENLKDYRLEFDDGNSICVVMASGGYPGAFGKGFEISFNGSGEAVNIENSYGLRLGTDYFIFHAGTRKDGGKYFTDGGRVLNICVKNKDAETAVKSVYEIAGAVKFENGFYRKDIGRELAGTENPGA